jgi:aldehyde dehydrogenase (NAD+)
VVLELGGKSPVVVAADADLEVAARRIIWGKLINAGQTCIAPDYVFVHESAEERLIGHLISEIRKMYGHDPLGNPDLPAIINIRAFGRLNSLISVSKVVSGGRSNSEGRTIEPTIVKASPDDEIMKDEIFGPVLPVLTFSDPDEVVSFINAREKPLALYVFSRSSRFFDMFVKRTSSGGILLNDVVIQFAQKYAAFGGVGESGLGRYHGYESFRSFSNMKAVMHSSTAIDIPMKYPPFGNKLKLVKWFLR